jgi:hypothetical protein
MEVKAERSLRTTAEGLRTSRSAGTCGEGVWRRLCVVMARGEQGGEAGDEGEEEEGWEEEGKKA